MPATYIGQNLYIRPTYIVSLPEYHSDTPSRSYDQVKNQENLKDNAHNGVLSRKAITKMRNAINWLLCGAEEKKVYNKKFDTWFNFKINFITLTLPDTSGEINNQTLQKKLLNPFLTYLRKYHKLKNYVWKLEFQKNGKLHVHLVSDTFIHHGQLRNVWNNQLEREGFLNEFAEKHGHRNPNSTDIHSVRKIKNLGAYMAKYMAKQGALLDKIKGRIWGCNYELSQANKTRLFLDRDECAIQLKPLMQSIIQYTPIGSIDKFTGEFKVFGEMFYLTYRNWMENITGDIKNKFRETISFLRSEISQDQIAFST